LRDLGEMAVAAQVHADKNTGIHPRMDAQL
jgi:hypothetical protein